MPQRLAALLVLASLLGLAASPAGAASQARIPFQIATGPVAGTFFPVGEAIAGLLSHPPGVGRCDTFQVCGPTGLIISARTSQGAVDNIIEVNDGEAESGLAQGDVIAAAVAGKGPFRARASHLRVIASLYDEKLHLVVAAKSKIAKVADLRGKRVSLGNERAGAGITMREVLAAYNLSEKSLKLVRSGSDGDVALMRAGKLDAFIAVGGAPLTGLADLFARGQARLVPIDGKGRDRLVKMVPSLAPAAIAARLYAGQGETQTVATRALWIVRDSVPDDLVFGLARALFQPLNRKTLAASHPSAREISLAGATISLPAPLHPGAARYYKSAQK